MTYDELVEKVARAMKPITSSMVDKLIEIGADRGEAIQMLPLNEARVVIDTIREALQKPTREMYESAHKHYEGEAYLPHGLWSAMLAASPLGEKAG